MYTTSRKWTIIAASFTMVFAALFLFFSNYAMQLIFFFVFSLALFHFILAFWVNIKKKFVQTWDYLYFFLLFIGFLIGITSTESEREQSRQRTMQAFFPPTLIATNDLIQNNQEWCMANLVPIEIYNFFITFTPFGGLLTMPTNLPAEYCDWIETIHQTLSENPIDYKKLQQAVDEKTFSSSYSEMLFNSIIVSMLRGHGLDKSDIMSYILSRPVIYQIDSVIIYQEQAKTEPLSEGVAELVWRYVSNWIWPFFVLIGLALRITRVTADVSEWPQA